MYEDTDSGLTYEYDESSKAWQPTLESLQQAQAKAYSVSGVDESAPAGPVLARENKRKKKDAGGNSHKKQKQSEQRNTAIYIEGLPQDVSKDEVAAVFSKAGIILGTPDPKIKLYEKEGRLNGTALVVFLQEESADLAVNWFDASPLRIGDTLEMKVTRAQFQNKQSSVSTNAEAGTSSSNSGKRSKVKSDPEKAAAQRQAEKLKK